MKFKVGDKVNIAAEIPGVLTRAGRMLLGGCGEVVNPKWGGTWCLVKIRVNGTDFIIGENWLSIKPKEEQMLFAFMKEDKE